MMSYNLCLYTPCMILVIVVRHLSFRFYWVQAVLCSNCKLESFVYSHRCTTFSSEKQCTVMWQVPRLSTSPELARPYVKASERKLRDVGFFGTSSNSKEEIKEFQCERVSEQLLYILIRAFSKIRILSWETGYLASISTASSPLKTKPSDHFKDLHKPRLLTKFHDNPTSHLKEVSKWKSVLRCSQCSLYSLALPGFQFENCSSYN